MAQSYYRSETNEAEKTPHTDHPPADHETQADSTGLNTPSGDQTKAMAGTGSANRP